MNPEDILKNLTPEIVARFRSAIETGRWPNGDKLTAEQRNTCMEAVIVYEHHTLPPEQRTGYVPPKATPCKTDDEQPLSWQSQPEQK
ncbi:YeaC family protein [Teredinibacter turnerae]|uniref:YeaC family protein n=1 Tax=Teredinibacter turnerae TaxID=2426 RepID=UPI0003767748|nr:DUF1315 family protein [Teredinibacter turnerae]